jgi:hypothetical protein
MAGRGWYDETTLKSVPRGPSMTNHDPILDEQRIEQLEREFPAASGFAFSEAYVQTLSAGFSVVVSENGGIYEIFPDGQRRLLKTITPPSPAQPGRKLTIP